MIPSKLLCHVNEVYEHHICHSFFTLWEEKATETVEQAAQAAQAAPDIQKDDESSLKLEENVEEKEVSEAAEVPVMEVESGEKVEAEEMEGPVEESEVTKIDPEKVDGSNAPLYALALFLL